MSKDAVTKTKTRTLVEADRRVIVPQASVLRIIVIRRDQEHSTHPIFGDRRVKPHNRTSGTRMVREALKPLSSMSYP